MWEDRQAGRETERGRKEAAEYEQRVFYTFFKMSDRKNVSKRIYVIATNANVTVLFR